VGNAVEINASGALDLGTSSVGTLVAEASGNITLSGFVTATQDLGDFNNTAIVLAAGGNFIEGGSGHLDPGAGRFIVYSQNPGANTLVDLTATPWYNTSYNSGDPSGVEGAGDRFAYSQSATLTVTGDDDIRLYGAGNPALTYGVTGFVNGDDPGSAMSGSAGISTDATVLSDVGGYDIAISLGSLVSDYNYEIELVAGTLLIDPAPLTVIAHDVVHIFGEDFPILSGHVTGFVNGEDESVLSGLTYISAGDDTSPPGDYSTGSAGGTATNYVIVTRTDGTLTGLPPTEASQISD
jgi:hypothetical protein